MSDEFLEMLVERNVVSQQQAEAIKALHADRNGDEELVLSVQRKQAPVTITQEDGTRKKYTLKELYGSGRSEYIDKMAKRIKMKDGKPTGMTSYSGVEAELISMCLYDDKGVLVTFQEASGWPSSTQQALFAKAQKMSALGVAAEQDAKNG